MRLGVARQRHEAGCADVESVDEMKLAGDAALVPGTERGPDPFCGGSGLGGFRRQAQARGLVDHEQMFVEVHDLGARGHRGIVRHSLSYPTRPAGRAGRIRNGGEARCDGLAPRTGGYPRNMASGGKGPVGASLALTQDRAHLAPP